MKLRCAISPPPRTGFAGGALRQLYATARLDGVRLVVGFPDLHPGNGPLVIAGSRVALSHLVQSTGDGENSVW